MLVTAMALLWFPALMAFAAASDLIHMTISNRISAALIAGFFVLALATGMPPALIGAHAAAGLVVLAVGFAFFAFGWIGGGDAKLAAATAVWIGFAGLADYLLYGSIGGGLLTFLLLRVRDVPLPATLEAQPWAARLHRKDTGVPYGIALAVAALIVYPQSPLMQALGR